jgi:hypothetical protein
VLDGFIISSPRHAHNPIVYLQKNAMQFNIKFDFAEVFNVNKVNVALGQKFKVTVVGSAASGDWYSNNDPVLFIDVDDDRFSAKIESREVGTSRIQIQQQVGSASATLEINVYDNVPVNLGLTAGEPELKG